MKSLVQVLVVALLIGVLAIAAYLFAEQEYVHRLELDKLHKTLTSVREELEAVKLADTRQHNATSAETLEQREQLSRLQRTVEDLRNSFQEWRGTRKTELDKTSEALATSHEKTRASLSSLQADIATIKEAYLSKNELPARLDQSLRAAVQAYHPVDITLGTLPSGKPPSATFKIPEAVPDSAREILVYTYIATDFVKGGSLSFKLAVKTDSAAEAAFYLHAVTDAQPGWSYNSDNVWLPLPADREISVTHGGGALFGNWDSKVKIIAYR
jgi:TolA-binding protein